MLAYRHAARLGADMLEMDMHATRGAVAELTLSQVLAADAGSALTNDGGQTFPFRGRGVRVARLSEVLATFPKTLLTVELKQETPSLAEPLCRALRQAGATSRVIAASFSDRALGEFRQACPEVVTSMTERELRPLVLLSKVGLARLARLPGRVAQVPVRAGGITVVTPAFVRAMHRRGVAVQVWTINDPGEMRRLIRMGVDAIITDRPDLLGAVLKEGERAGS